jgi:hypothetical protein
MFLGVGLAALFALPASAHEREDYRYYNGRDTYRQGYRSTRPRVSIDLSLGRGAALRFDSGRYRSRDYSYDHGRYDRGYRYDTYDDGYRGGYGYVDSYRDGYNHCR